MKRMLPALFALCLLFALTACHDPAPEAEPREPLDDKAGLDYRAVYDTTLGILVSIGMSREEIDIRLGDSELKSGLSHYADFNISIGYEDGTAIELETSDPRWVLEGDIGVGFSVADLDDDWFTFDRYYLKLYGDNGSLLALDDIMTHDIAVALGHQNGLVDVILLY